MNKRDVFIKEISNAIENGLNLSGDANIFFEALKSESTSKPAFTENGKIILTYMQNNKDSYSNLFKSKDIAEGSGLLSKTVSGSMRKLVNDNYVEKIGGNPVVYSLTQEGINITFEEE